MTFVPLCPTRLAAFSVKPSLCTVTRQQLRLVLRNLGELAFQRFGDAGVKSAPWLPQQRAIGRVLHQGMFE